MEVTKFLVSFDGFQTFQNFCMPNGNKTIKNRSRFQTLSIVNFIFFQSASTTVGAKILKFETHKNE
jgi:hypothetical protein